MNHFYRGVGIGVAVAILIFISMANAQTLQYELFPYNPVANSKAVVKAGCCARFTVLTANLIRIEWDDQGKFEDQATPAVVNRNLPVPPFNLTTTGNSVTITTTQIQLQYSPVGAPFNQTTLQVIGIDPNLAFKQWNPSMPNVGNLLGTIRSLDQLNVISLNCTQNANVTINGESLHCEWGLISRNGWVVYDDTQNWGLTSQNWWDSKNDDEIDWYLFAYGHYYTAAIQDYTLIGGSVAMVPRYVTGVWWSRWYNYNNLGTESVVHDYVSRSIPLDVYVLDMDWHTKEGWGGYTFDGRLFPFPEDSMGWLNHHGLAVTLNVHDADGVRPTERMYKEMCQAMGLNPATAGTIQFSIVNQTYCYSLEDVVLQHLEQVGVSFWWIDWQQGGTTGGGDGNKQNPTIWLNHLRATDALRRAQNASPGNYSTVTPRGLVLARWGGMGNHRYQVGFSGDVAQLTWTDLAFQPYFTMTASNVAYGFWSHDVVGPSDDHELHTRWIQWSAYSGVMRTHDRGMSAGGCNDDSPPDCAIVRVWNVPVKYFEANRAVLQRRISLVPYIYNAYRIAFETGISIVRPMYYEFPLADWAYAASPNGTFDQYFFGPDMWVAPVVVPANSNTQMAQVQLWMPPGVWFELDTGTLHTGGNSTMLTKSFDLGEVPVFIRAGAIIPTIPVRQGQTLSLARQPYHNLIFTVYPGSNQGITQVYEDDGLTTAYLHQQYTVTRANYTRTSTSLSMDIKMEGSFKEMPTQRGYQLHIANGLPASKVQVVVNTLGADKQGKSTVKSQSTFNVYYSRYENQPNTWTYRGRDLTTIVNLAPLPAANTLITITVTYFQPLNDSLMAGWKGALLHANLAKNNLDEDWTTPAGQTTVGGYLSLMASSAEALSYFAGGQINTTDSSYFFNTYAGCDQNGYCKDSSFSSSSEKTVIDGWQAFNETMNGWRTMYNLALQETLALQQPVFTGRNDPLLQLWDQGRYDSCLCGTQNCLNDNNYYQQVRIEGYQPSAGTAGTVPLNDYWSAQAQDNWVTTATSTPNGYQKADFSNGYVFATAQPNTVPLKLYYSAERQDHLTVASQQGIDFAESRSYTLVNGTLGYVYPANGSPSMASHRAGLRSPAYAIPSTRLNYSIALLQAALV